jgi:hypothetical protein
MENPQPEALIKRFDTILQRTPLQMILGSQSFTHREVLVSMAVQCRKIGAVTQALTTEDARVVADKAPRISELLRMMSTETHTSRREPRSDVGSSQELALAGVNS